MTKEERAELLRMAIVEAGSIRDGLKLFRELVSEFDDPTPPVFLKVAEEPIKQPRQQYHKNTADVRTSKKWTEEEIAVCKSMANNRATFAEIGKAVGRSPNAIYHAWYMGLFDHPDRSRDNIKKGVISRT